MRIYIRYMVTIRCAKVVQMELEKLGLNYTSIEIGYVDLGCKIGPEEHDQLKGALKKWELELVDDKKTILVEKIKKLIIDFVYDENEPAKVNFSTYLNEKLGYDYTYLSNLFSETTAIGLENYIIAIKVDRVKELLMHSEFTISEISYKMRYSSVAHLSNQFKKYTGLTPSAFKHIQQLRLEREQTTY